MEIKSHLFQIMRIGFLHSILLFLYLSVLLKPNLLKKKKKRKNTWFSPALSFIMRQGTLDSVCTLLNEV